LLPGLSALTGAPAYAGSLAEPRERLPDAAQVAIPMAGKTEELGSSVALARANGTDFAFAGAPVRNHDDGIVYIYARNGSQLHRQQ
jgi:hypothetical protein